jgi:hypothetical protein
MLREQSDGSHAHGTFRVVRNDSAAGGVRVQADVISDMLRASAASGEPGVLESHVRVVIEWMIAPSERLPILSRSIHTDSRERIRVVNPGLDGQFTSTDVESAEVGDERLSVTPLPSGSDAARSR